jgi:hypothetical protein
MVSEPLSDPGLARAAGEPQFAITQPAGRRKLDFFVAVFNRPRSLHHLLRTGLALGIPGASFVVYDDASDLVEDVDGIGPATVESVCRGFHDARVIYVRNAANIGFAKSLEAYYRDVCASDYTALLNPKDEFVGRAAIDSALAKLDADPKLSMVVYSLRHADRVEADRPLIFAYRRMTGPEFIAAHVRDEVLQHCSSYAIVRVAAARIAGAPRNLDLRALGLEDGSGIDHDLIFNVATTGDVEFESDPPLRRSIAGGYTELYPLTFAYAQYQYARRLMIELEARGIVSAETRRRYLGLWHLIIVRGLLVAYRPVHGTEKERGVARIRPHLSGHILLYLPAECLRFGVWPRAETIGKYLVGARLMLSNWLRKMLGLQHTP